MNNALQIMACSVALASFVNAAEAPAKPGAQPPAKVKVEQEGMKSSSKTFSYNLKRKLAIYEGNVRVIDVTLDLSCDKLTIVFLDKKKEPAPKDAKKVEPKEAGNLPLGPMVGMGGNVKMLIAEGNVVIKNRENKNKAVGDKAVYTQLTEQVVLTSKEGNPLPKIIDENGGELSAPVIIYDRLTGNLNAKQGVGINQGDPQKSPPEKAPPAPPVRRLGTPDK